MSRFSENADAMVARQQARATDLVDELRAFLVPAGDERALDVGTGTGALALALAGLVAEVTGVDEETELLDRARQLAPGNASFVEGDATALPFADGSFDLAAMQKVLHHVHRPELAMAELARVTRPGGRVLVIDQLAPIDPLEAFAVDRFERARTSDHERLLSDQDLRGLFDVNRLVLVRERRVTERREVGAFLDMAGCQGEAREQALGLAPHGPETYAAEVGWYLTKRL